ncbi:MAG TPA: hypothetical protein HPP97_00965 [Desulfuromonadales bacterium]|nr:hypothetical protein [Desulfuromonadales bacterium]
MVPCAWDYPWSSAAYHTNRPKSDPLVKDRTHLRVETDWEEYLSGGISLALGQLRMATQTGRPAGDDAFIAKMSDLTGRNLRKVKPALLIKQ